MLKGNQISRKKLKKMIKVLFVCLGNICRSPLAEAIFKEKVQKRGLENYFSIDSAGTSDYHLRSSPDPRTILIAEKYNIPIEHKARQFSVRDGQDYDYVIAMDFSNRENILKVAGGSISSLFLMRDFDPGPGDREVPDPYFGAEDGFENVYRILDRSADSLLNYLIKEHKLSNV